MVQAISTEDERLMRSPDGRRAVPTKELVREVMWEVDDLDLPDGAHWALVHERLGLEYGDVFDIIAADIPFFNQPPSMPPDPKKPKMKRKAGVK